MCGGFSRERVLSFCNDRIIIPSKRVPRNVKRRSSMNHDVYYARNQITHAHTRTHARTQTRRRLKVSVRLFPEIRSARVLLSANPIPSLNLLYIDRSWKRLVKFLREILRNVCEETDTRAVSRRNCEMVLLSSEATRSKVASRSGIHEGGCDTSLSRTYVFVSRA